MRNVAIRVLAASLLILQVTGCKQQTVREPYPVEIVREVVKPIPREFTTPLTYPTLPEGTITVLTLVEHVKAWQAWGKTANDHRARVAELSKGK